MAEFGTPETWNMKVGDFIETELPKEKPQALLDLQEQNRKQRLLDSLQKIGPGLMDESVDFIERQNFNKKGLAMTPAAIKQRRYRLGTPYKLKTTDIVVDGVKYTIPNNAMKPESAKGLIKFLNKLEKNPTVENYGKLVKGLPKDVANQIRNYRYYLQGIKSGSFAGEKKGLELKKLYPELNLPKQATDLLSKITTKDIKGQVIKTATKAAGEAAKSTSMDVVNAVRDIFVNDPDNAPSLDDVAEGLEGTKKFNAAGASEKIKMRTNASNAVNQFLQAVTADRKVKGFKDVAPDTLGDIIQYIDDNKRGEFRFAEGFIRDYKIKLRDSLIKGDFGKQRRNIPAQKGKVIDEVFGLSATFEDAPGYTENVQIISNKINKIKAKQIDKPFAAILKAVKEGKEVVQYGGDRNVPISKAVKDFNAKSKTFSNKNKVSTPQILLGDNLDATKLVSNFKDYSPQAQRNILDLSDEGFVLTSTKPATPAGKLNFKPGMQDDGRLVDLEGGQSKGFFGGKELAGGLLKTLQTLGTPAGVVAAELGLPGGIRSQLQKEGLEKTLRNPITYLGPVLANIGAEAVKNPALQRALNLGIPIKYIRAGTPVGLGLAGISGLVDSALKFQEEFDALSPEEQKKYLEEQEEFGEDVQGAAEGGIMRIGLAEGPKKKGLKSPGRRKFMKDTGKLAGILALIPYLGKFLAPAAKSPVIQEGAKLGFDNFLKLVAKIKAFGKEDPARTTLERQKATTYTGKDGSEYELIEDISTGDIRVIRDKSGVGVSGDKSYDVIEDRSTFEFKIGQADETTKGKKPPDEYDEGKAVFDQDGTVADIDEVDDATIKAIEDEIN